MKYGSVSEEMKTLSFSDFQDSVKIKEKKKDGDTVCCIPGTVFIPHYPNLL